MEAAPFEQVVWGTDGCGGSSLWKQRWETSNPGWEEAEGPGRSEVALVSKLCPRPGSSRGQVDFENPLVLS